MKKNFLILVMTLAALFTANAPVHAYDCEVDGIYYCRISTTEVEVTNKVFSDQNRAAYSGAVTIPATITYNGKTFNVVSIGEYAFRGCLSMTSITIPSSITAIKSFAFYNCSALAAVNIPASVKTIGAGAFEGCTSLTQMVLPDGLPAIEDETFHGCTGLKGIVIPSSVSAVGEEAFSRCTSLISIYCFAKTPPACEMTAFTKVDRTWCTLYVPHNSKYKDNDAWKEFFIEEYDGKPDDINFSNITK